VATFVRSCFDFWIDALLDTGASLVEFESEQPLSSSCLSGDGKTLVTVEHGKLNSNYGFPEGDATVAIRNVDTGALRCL
jgi:hypothetical protein